MTPNSISQVVTLKKILTTSNVSGFGSLQSYAAYSVKFSKEQAHIRNDNYSTHCDTRICLRHSRYADIAVDSITDVYIPTSAGKSADGCPSEAAIVRIAFAMLGWLGNSTGALRGTVLYEFVIGPDWM